MERRGTRFLGVNTGMDGETLLAVPLEWSTEGAQRGESERQGEREGERERECVLKERVQNALHVSSARSANKNLKGTSSTHRSSG